MPAANDLKKGQVITFNGEPHLIMETQHRTPGNLRAFVQVKMRNLRYGKSLEQRFNSPDHVDVLQTDRRTLEFSYADREVFSFMDPETFETFEPPWQAIRAWIPADDDESPTDTPELWDQTTGTGWKTPETDPGDGRTPVLEYT